MKELAVMLLVFALMGCAGPRLAVKRLEPHGVIRYTEFQKLGEDAGLNDYVAYLNEGDTIPLLFFVDTSVVGIVQKKVDLLARQKLYFRIEMPETFQGRA